MTIYFHCVVGRVHLGYLTREKPIFNLEVIVIVVIVVMVLNI